ncbi:FecCD family ABC transporter permease [Paracoccus methylarcula]|uniref:Iron ABC transporter permease n=1 Tax=Paracoccus methylarcula TaxID=72022 RepID=A0A422QZA0_9RHOB|nr:iron ABC transporter permease [Paracoccus methylarcula]RNF35306.1 iron ABC transporter permease [Paracoccus methylarcula]
MKPARATDGQELVHFGHLQFRARHLRAGLLLLGVAAALSLVSTMIGVTRIGGSDITALLRGGLVDDAGFALREVRLPRIAAGFMAGWCVALTGAMLQSLARNPLADPGLLGLSQGSMVMILLLILFAPAAPPMLLPFAAMTGALAVALALVLLVGRGGAGGLALLLMGIAVETMLSSVTQILILYSPPDMSYALSNWLAGSLSGADPAAVLALLPWFLFSLGMAVWLGRSLSTYDLGQDLAMSLGENVNRSRPLILVVSVLLSSAAVTAAGPLAFLGVMAPHLAGFLSPASGRPRLILSGLMGAVLVIAADMLTRSVSGELALPLGLSLTLVGVPLFVISLRLRALKTLSNR